MLLANKCVQQAHQNCGGVRRASYGMLPALTFPLFYPVVQAFIESVWRVPSPQERECERYCSLGSLVW
jgi:hypothetical protein